MNESLKPCPFCGSMDLFVSKWGASEVRCRACHAIGPVVHESTQKERDEKAIKAWNRRANND